PSAAAQTGDGPGDSTHSVWARIIQPSAIALVLAALSFAALQPIVENEFLTWDDDLNFVKNPYYRGLGWSQVAWAWTTFHLGSYPPLGWMLFSAEWSIWGVEPRGYHAVSLLLHAATAAALYVLTSSLARRCKMPIARGSALPLWAGLAVASYAVHPLRVETVA